jgi:hypothetical protein
MTIKSKIFYFIFFLFFFFFFVTTSFFFFYKEATYIHVVYLMIRKQIAKHQELY